MGYLVGLKGNVQAFHEKVLIGFPSESNSALARISQTGSYAIDRQEDGLSKASPFALLMAGSLLCSFIQHEGITKCPQTTQERYLEIA